MRNPLGCIAIFILLSVGCGLYLLDKASTQNDNHSVANNSDPNVRVIDYSQSGGGTLTEHRFEVTGEVAVAQTCYGQSENLLLDHTKYGDAIQCNLKQTGDSCSNTSTLQALQPVDDVLNHHVATRYKTATVKGWAADSDHFSDHGRPILNDCEIVSYSTKLGPPEDIYGRLVK